MYVLSTHVRTMLFERSQVENEFVCALPVSSLEQHRIALYRWYEEKREIKRWEK